MFDNIANTNKEKRCSYLITLQVVIDFVYPDIEIKMISKPDIKISQYFHTFYLDIS